MSDTIQSKTANARREHILAAATQVFAERGFHRAPIRDVAIAAGVSDGTMYNSFANKNALLMGMLEPLGTDIPVAGDPTLAPTTVEALVGTLVDQRWKSFTPNTLAALRVVLSEVLVNAELRTLFIRRMIAPVLTMPEPAFHALAADGQITTADIPMTIRIVTSTFLGLVMLRLLGDEHLEDRAGKVPDALAEFLLNGLRPRGAEDAHGAV